MATIRQVARRSYTCASIRSRTPESYIVAICTFEKRRLYDVM